MRFAMFVEVKRPMMTRWSRGARSLGVVAVILATWCSSLSAAERWQTTVSARTPGLPPVTLRMGEPGPYVATKGTRIELAVSDSPVAFSGYLGFYYSGTRPNLAQTRELPVIAPVTITRGGSWRFETYTSSDRESASNPAETTIVVEWRNAMGRRIAQESAGRPPWSAAAPLRILRAGEVREADELLLGQRSFQRSVAELSSHAQWYAGVSSVVTAVDVWLDLPVAVREAIFASGVPLVFSGAPRAGQPLLPLDQALLPVTFQPRPSRTVVPWPYATEKRELALPWSWVAKAGTRIAGETSSPYLVASPLSVYAADESALRTAIPGMLLLPARSSNRNAFLDGGRPTVREIFDQFRPLLTAIAMVILSMAIWFAVRRNPRLLYLGIAVVVSVSVVLLRNQIRAASGTYHWEEITPVAPGVVRRFQAFHDFAQARLPERRTDAATARTSITGHGNGFQVAEIRTVQTAPGHGALLRFGRQADGMTRWSVRNELGEAPRVQIEGRGSRTLEIDYQSPAPVHFVAAQWVCGDTFCRGAMRMNGAKAGHASLADGAEVWPLLFPDPFISPRIEEGDVQLFLVEQKRSGLRLIDWIEPTSGGAAVRVQAPLHPGPGGALTSSVVLPPSAGQASRRFAVSIRNALPVAAIRVTGEGGSVDLQVGGRLELVAMQQYSAPPEALARIAPNGGILQIVVEPGKPQSDRWTHRARYPYSLLLHVWENKQ